MEVGVGMLWLPTLASTIIVFFAGYLIYMVLPHHRTDFDGIDEEDRFLAELRTLDLARGQYKFPFASSPIDLHDPEYVEKVKRGPTGILVVCRNESGPTLKQVFMHFVHVFVISAIVACIAGATLPGGTEYIKVFQIAGGAAFLGYAGSIPENSIWFHFSWPMSLKSVLDALLYAGLTGGLFGWLWPGM